MKYLNPKRLLLLLLSSVFLGATILCMSLPSQAQVSPIVLTPPGGNAKFPRSFFGMHVHNRTATPNWPTIPIGSLRLWDARVNWAHLEPNPGAWQFRRLDDYFSWAESHAVDIVLPLGITPRWASARPDEPGAYGPGTAAEPYNLELWRNYVRTLAQRYSGRVFAYEISNEANISSFYSGSKETLAQMVRIASEEIRRYSPSSLIVAPSGVGLDQRVAWPSQIMASGLSGAVDIASFHLYHTNQTPEAMIVPAQKIRSQLAAAGFANIPIWNTETGYWLANNQESWSAEELKNVASIDKVAQYIPRDMLLARALGFERYYWYAWDSTKMGFIDLPYGKPRSTAAILGQSINNLMRATLQRCERSSRGIWTCFLTAANGKQMQAVWTDPSGPQDQEIAAPFDGRWALLDGKDNWQSTAAGTTVKIGPMVVLIREGN